MRYFFFIIAIFFAVTPFQLLAQDTEATYQSRIKKETINGVYIPADISECFTELNRLVSKEARAKFQAMPENEARVRLHFSLGRWIWHNWSFYEGSRLSVYLNKVGVHHPEDMATFIIVSYHRYLNKKPLEPQALAAELEKNRNKKQ